MPTTIPTTTSSTRPGSPSTGDAYFETDTKNYIIYDGANWRGYASDTVFGWTGSNIASVDLDGIDDYISTATSYQSTFRDSHSVSMWVKPDDGITGSYHYLFSAINSDSSRIYNYRQDPDGKVALYFRTDTGDAVFAKTNSAVFVDGANDWKHLCLVVDNGVAKQCYIYVNGTAVTLDASNNGSISSPFQGSVSLSDYTSTTNPDIGGQNNNGSHGSTFAGLIDEVAVFNSALNQTQINTLRGGASAGTLGSPANIASLSPFSWYRMGDNNGSSGTTIFDQGSGGNNATLQNGAVYSSSVPS